MKKIVGIPCARSTEPNGVCRNYVNAAYCNAVKAAGALAVLLPVGDPEDAPRYLDRIDGLLLPGGIDVAPHHYGHEPHPNLGSTDDDQDRFEIAIAQEAFRRRMPILAICRGIQLLNVALGGTLIQDLPSDAPSEIGHRQAAARPETTHEIHVDSDSLLYRMAGDRMAVNSFHHQAIRDVAPGLRIVARAPDGIIEALESETHPLLLALQCHPEEMAVLDPIAQRLFREFVEWL